MDRLKGWLKPRAGTDLESEILNIVAAPIYVYTITSLYIHCVWRMLPYFYANPDDQGTTLSLTLHRAFVSLVYFQMMSNWLGIRFVHSNFKSTTRFSSLGSNKLTRNGGTPSSTSGLQDVRVEKLGERKTRGGSSLIPGPLSAPTAPSKSYWAWKICDKCNINRPPRCHHCPICETCVLKRDHHCFFARNCVGFNNQRHFFIFCCWASLGTSYAALHIVPYFYRQMWPTIHPLDIFGPTALLRLLLGYGSLYITNLIWTFTFLFFFVLLSTNFAVDQMGLIASGLTSFETKNLNTDKLSITDPRPLSEKIRAVLGHNWGISFIVPIWHLVNPPHENPIDWPETKVHRSRK